MSAAPPKSPLAPHNRVEPTPPKLAGEPAPKPAAAPAAAADLDDAPQDGVLEVSEESGAPPQPKRARGADFDRTTGVLAQVEARRQQATISQTRVYDEVYEAEIAKGTEPYLAKRAANIASGRAFLDGLGLGGSGGGVAALRRKPRAQPAVNYSEQDAAAEARARERAARADAKKAERDAERERKLREKLAKREAKLAAAAERAAAKVEAANQKDAKLAAFAAAYALSESDADASPPDMSLLSTRDGKAFRTGFLAFAVERYPGSEYKANEKYVIQVSESAGDLDGKRPSTKTDALYSLDQAYADAGTKGGDVFRKEYQHNGLWGAVLYKDRNLGPHNPARADAVVAYYKPWLPPWKRS